MIQKDRSVRYKKLDPIKVFANPFELYPLHSALDQLEGKRKKWCDKISRELTAKMANFVWVYSEAD